MCRTARIEHRASDQAKNSGKPAEEGKRPPQSTQDSRPESPTRTRAGTPRSYAVITAIDEQSTDIAMGVDKALEAKEHLMDDSQLEAIGARDQGMMFGYATNETPELMPYAISLAHKLAKRLTDVRKDGTLPYLRPDGKTQVTVEYDENGKPIRLEAVVLSTQHSEEVSQEQIHEDIKKYVFDPILPADMVDADTKFFINPTGRFVIGGPHGDSGLTGRKIIVDTYGGYARHGGGAFSGKDCTKVEYHIP